MTYAFNETIADRRQKTKIIRTGHGEVSLCYDDGEAYESTCDDNGNTIVNELGYWRVERSYTLRGGDKGYIYERLANNDVRQVCDGLARMGDALYCNDERHLLSIIRAEWKRGRAEIMSNDYDNYLRSNRVLGA